MTTLREAAKQALSAIEDSGHKADLVAAASALRAALEQPETEPEPVAWRIRRDGIWSYRGHDVPGLVTEPLYAAPPQHKPLSDEGLMQIWDTGVDELRWGFGAFKHIARAIESAHGIGEAK